MLVQPLSWYSLSSCISLRREPPSIEKTVEGEPDWVRLPVIATVARLLCRELTLENEYLRLANRILKEKVSGRIRFADEERRPLTRMSSAPETTLRALWRTDEFLDTAGCLW